MVIPFHSVPSLKIARAVATLFDSVVFTTPPEQFTIRKRCGTCFYIFKSVFFMYSMPSFLDLLIYGCQHATYCHYLSVQLGQYKRDG